MVEFKPYKTGEVSYRLQPISLNKCEERYGMSDLYQDLYQDIYEIRTTLGTRVAIPTSASDKHRSEVIKDCRKLILHELFKDILLDLQYLKRDIYEGNMDKAISKINNIYYKLTEVKDE